MPVRLPPTISVPAPKLCHRKRETRRQWDWYHCHHQTAFGCEFGWLVTRVWNEWVCLVHQYPPVVERNGHICWWATSASVRQSSRYHLGTIRMEATYHVFNHLNAYLSNRLENDKEITYSGVLSLESELRTKARRLLKAKPGQTFRTYVDWGASTEDVALIDLHRPTGKLDIHACRHLWTRGKVYQHWADELQELVSRWDYLNYQMEFADRFYDKYGRMIQPQVSKRPRTVAKVLANRPAGSYPSYGGGFLDA